MIMVGAIEEIDHIMSPDEISSLVALLSNGGNGLTLNEIKTALYNNNSSHSPYLIPTLSFLECIGIIACDGLKYTTTSNKNDKKCLLGIMVDLLSNGSDNQLFHTDYLEDRYYSESKSLSVLPACRNYLIEIGFFKEITGTKYYVDTNYSSLVKKHTSKISQKQLESIIEKEKEVGLKAELFVLDFERKRLSNSHNKDKIRHISPDDASAGFDILSLDNVNVVSPRYIEVKSYHRYIDFYWSKNEMDVAEKKGPLYFLYLVDSCKIEDANYSPLIIQDPIKALDNRDWSSTVEKKRYRYLPA